MRILDAQPGDVLRDFVDHLPLRFGRVFGAGGNYILVAERWAKVNVLHFFDRNTACN